MPATVRSSVDARIKRQNPTSPKLKEGVKDDQDTMQKGGVWYIVGDSDKGTYQVPCGDGDAEENDANGEVATQVKSPDLKGLQDIRRFMSPTKPAEPPDGGKDKDREKDRENYEKDKEKDSNKKDKEKDTKEKDKEKDTKEKDKEKEKDTNKNDKEKDTNKKDKEKDTKEKDKENSEQNQRQKKSTNFPLGESRKPNGMNIEEKDEEDKEKKDKEKEDKEKEDKEKEDKEKEDKEKDEEDKKEEEEIEKDKKDIEKVEDGKDGENDEKDKENKEKVEDEKDKKDEEKVEDEKDKEKVEDEKDKEEDEKDGEKDKEPKSKRRNLAGKKESRKRNEQKEEMKEDGVATKGAAKRSSRRSRTTTKEVKPEEEEEEEVDDVEEYEVEKILFHRVLYRKNFYYYVKWKGYTCADNTWEPYHNLDNCKSLRDVYHNKMAEMEKDNKAEFDAIMEKSKRTWPRTWGKKEAAGSAQEAASSPASTKAPPVISSPLTNCPLTSPVTRLKPTAASTPANRGSSAASTPTANRRRDSTMATLDSDDVFGTPEVITKYSTPLKRKSEDLDEDEDSLKAADKRVKLSAGGGFLQKWLQSAKKPLTPDPKKKTASASKTPSSSFSSPSVRNPSSSTKSRLSVSSLSTNIYSDSKVSADEMRRKEEQTKVLKEWEREINRVSKDPAGIIVINDVDAEGPPPGFTYINDYLARNNIVFSDDPLLGCTCDECDGKKTCCPKINDAKMAYNKYKRLRMTGGSLHGGEPIYECNKLCHCGTECQNRVVQLGRQVRLAIFRTTNRGWGVKTLQDIKMGQYVMTYLGEVIDHDEAEKRGKIYDEEGMTYLFDLDYANDDQYYTCDAAKFGNISHFVNHSCDPNLKIFNVYINNININLPYICLFACKEIKKNTELNFDYKMSGPTEDLEDSLLETGDINDSGASLSESRYDADRSSEESQIFVSARSTVDRAAVSPTKEFDFRHNISNEICSTPRRRANVSKATPLHKKTRCLCGTAICRKYLMA